MTKAQQVLKHSRKALAGILCGWWVITASAPALAAANKKLQEMTYDVYAGGFHVVDAHLDVDFSRAGRYRLELGAKTRGFLGEIAPWDGTFETMGWQSPKPGGERAETHVTTTV